MDAFIILREISEIALQRKRLIALWIGISILVGLFVAFRPGLPPESRQYQVWIASVDILVDTTDSQVVDAKGPDPGKLANRASLLGNLVATKPLKSAIGEAAGLAPEQLVVVPPAPESSFGPPTTPAPVTPAASRLTRDQDANILTLSTDESQPILHATAQAPSAETAGRLATGTLNELKSHLAEAQARAPASHPLVVRPLAVRPAAPETRGASPLLGLGAALLVALLGCAVIVGAPMLGRRWAQAEALADTNGHAGNADNGHAEVEPRTIPFERTASHARAHDAEPEHDDERELATAAVVAVPRSIGTDVEQPISRKKGSSRRRRKHGRPR